MFILLREIKGAGYLFFEEINIFKGGQTMSKRKNIAIVVLSILAVALIFFGVWLFTPQEEVKLRSEVYSGQRKTYIKETDEIRNCGYIWAMFGSCASARMEITGELETGAVKKINVVRESDGEIISQDINSNRFTYNFELGNVSKGDMWQATALLEENSKGSIEWSCYVREYGYQKLLRVIFRRGDRL